MNRASQSLAWAGIGLVALGMVVAFVAVIAGGSGKDGAQEGARVVTVDQGGTPVTTPPPTPDGAATSEPASGAPANGAIPSTAGEGTPDTAGSGGGSSAGSQDSDTGGQPTPSTSDAEGPTLTTAAGQTLEDRLLSTAAAAGFVVFALDQPGWRITALDAGGSGSSAYLTLAYENGEDYINLSQSPSGARPSLADAEPVTLRGLSGELAEMRPVLLLRWDEEGTGLLFSTDLSRDRALALAERLQPLR